VWLAVLIIIPSGMLTGSGVFRLANLLVPVPSEVLEQFSREILPEGVPFWQVILLASVLPGLCEEIAFRGTLLHGLRRRFRPVTLALVVGLIFGLFHVSLFRIVPTAFLGVVLTAMALLTGSIFPGMVAHAGNNAFALWIGVTGRSAGVFDWWVYGVAALALVGGFAILYRVRTPYPDLRPGRR
jgi:sodium transport system permease protein